jgi:hypothetical protein
LLVQASLLLLEVGSSSSRRAQNSPAPARHRKSPLDTSIKILNMYVELTTQSRTGDHIERARMDEPAAPDDLARA